MNDSTDSEEGNITFQACTRRVFPRPDYQVRCFSAG